jgi:hypothetical protein
MDENKLYIYRLLDIIYHNFLGIIKENTLKQINLDIQCFVIMFLYDYDYLYHKDLYDEWINLFFQTINYEKKLKINPIRDPKKDTELMNKIGILIGTLARTLSIKQSMLLMLRYIFNKTFIKYKNFEEYVQFLVYLKSKYIDNENKTYKDYILSYKKTYENYEIIRDRLSSASLLDKIKFSKGAKAILTYKITLLKFITGDISKLDEDMFKSNIFERMILNGYIDLYESHIFDSLLYQFIYDFTRSIYKTQTPDLKDQIAIFFNKLNVRQQINFIKKLCYIIDYIVFYIDKNTVTNKVKELNGFFSRCIIKKKIDNVKFDKLGIFIYYVLLYDTDFRYMFEILNPLFILQYIPNFLVGYLLIVKKETIGLKKELFEKLVGLYIKMKSSKQTNIFIVENNLALYIYKNKRNIYALDNYDKSYLINFNNYIKNLEIEKIPLFLELEKNFIPLIQIDYLTGFLKKLLNFKIQFDWTWKITYRFYTTLQKNIKKHVSVLKSPHNILFYTNLKEFINIHKSYIFKVNRTDENIQDSYIKKYIENLTEANYRNISIYRLKNYIKYTKELLVKEQKKLDNLNDGYNDLYPRKYKKIIFGYLKETKEKIEKKKKEIENLKTDIVTKENELINYDKQTDDFIEDKDLNYKEAWDEIQIYFFPQQPIQQPIVQQPTIIIQQPAVQRTTITIQQPTTITTEQPTVQPTTITTEQPITTTEETTIKITDVKKIIDEYRIDIRINMYELQLLAEAQIKGGEKKKIQLAFNKKKGILRYFNNLLEYIKYLEKDIKKIEKESTKLDRKYTMENIRKNILLKIKNLSTNQEQELNQLDKSMDNTLREKRKYEKQEYTHQKEITMIWLKLKNKNLYTIPNYKKPVGTPVELLIDNIEKKYENSKLNKSALNKLFNKQNNVLVKKNEDLKKKPRNVQLKQEIENLKIINNKTNVFYVKENKDYNFYVKNLNDIITLDKNIKKEEENIKDLENSIDIFKGLISAMLKGPLNDDEKKELNQTEKQQTETLEKIKLAKENITKYYSAIPKIEKNITEYEQKKKEDEQKEKEKKKIISKPILPKVKKIEIKSLIEKIKKNKVYVNKNIENLKEMIDKRNKEIQILKINNPKSKQLENLTNENLKDSTFLNKENEYIKSYDITLTYVKGLQQKIENKERLLKLTGVDIEGASDKIDELEKKKTLKQSEKDELTKEQTRIKNLLKLINVINKSLSQFYEQVLKLENTVEKQIKEREKEIKEREKQIKEREKQIKKEELLEEIKLLQTLIKQHKINLANKLKPTTVHLNLKNKNIKQTIQKISKKQDIDDNIKKEFEKFLKDYNEFNKQINYIIDLNNLISDIKNDLEKISQMQPIDKEKGTKKHNLIYEDKINKITNKIKEIEKIEKIDDKLKNKYKTSLEIAKDLQKNLTQDLLKYKEYVSKYNHLQNKLKEKIKNLVIEEKLPKLQLLLKYYGKKESIENIKNICEQMITLVKRTFGDIIDNFGFNAISKVTTSFVLINEKYVFFFEEFLFFFDKIEEIIKVKYKENKQLHDKIEEIVTIFLKKNALTKSIEESEKIFNRYNTFHKKFSEKFNNIKTEGVNLAKIPEEKKEQLKQQEKYSKWKAEKSEELEEDIKQYDQISKSMSSEKKKIDENKKDIIIHKDILVKLEKTTKKIKQIDEEIKTKKEEIKQYFLNVLQFNIIQSQKDMKEYIKDAQKLIEQIEIKETEFLSLGNISLNNIKNIIKIGLIINLKNIEENIKLNEKSVKSTLEYFKSGSTTLKKIESEKVEYQGIKNNIDKKIKALKSLRETKYGNILNILILYADVHTNGINLKNFLIDNFSKSTIPENMFDDINGYHEKLETYLYRFNTEKKNYLNKTVGKGVDKTFEIITNQVEKWKNLQSARDNHINFAIQSENKKGYKENNFFEQIKNYETAVTKYEEDLNKYIKDYLEIIKGNKKILIEEQKQKLETIEKNNENVQLLHSNAVALEDYIRKQKKRFDEHKKEVNDIFKDKITDHTKIKQKLVKKKEKLEKKKIKINEKNGEYLNILGEITNNPITKIITDYDKLVNSINDKLKDIEKLITNENNLGEINAFRSQMKNFTNLFKVIKQKMEPNIEKINEYEFPEKKKNNEKKLKNDLKVFRSYYKTYKEMIKFESQIKQITFVQGTLYNKFTEKPFGNKEIKSGFYTAMSEYKNLRDSETLINNKGIGEKIKKTINDIIHLLFTYYDTIGTKEWEDEKNIIEDYNEYNKIKENYKESKAFIEKKYNMENIKIIYKNIEDIITISNHLIEKIFEIEKIFSIGKTEDLDNEMKQLANDKQFELDEKIQKINEFKEKIEKIPEEYSVNMNRYFLGKITEKKDDYEFISRKFTKYKSKIEKNEFLQKQKKKKEKEKEKTIQDYTKLISDYNIYLNELLNKFDYEKKQQLLNELKQFNQKMIEEIKNSDVLNPDQKIVNTKLFESLPTIIVRDILQQLFDEIKKRYENIMWSVSNLFNNDVENLSSYKESTEFILRTKHEKSKTDLTTALKLRKDIEVFIENIPKTPIIHKKIPEEKKESIKKFLENLQEHIRVSINPKIKILETKISNLRTNIRKAIVERSISRRNEEKKRMQRISERKKRGRGDA